MADDKTLNETKEAGEKKPEELGLGEKGDKGGKGDGDKKKKAEGKSRKKKKMIRAVPVGRAYIQATYNNTIVTLTDQQGNVIAYSSAGLNGFKGPKKATPFAATTITKDAVEKSRPYGLRDVNAFVKGVGLGREAAIRALNACGLNVLAIKDITPIPHNGCKRRKPRKV
jgi:small subunit ribosomal protein S11